MTASLGNADTITESEAEMAVDIGEWLAEIAVRLNDFSPPTYRTYIGAFEEAYPILTTAREMGAARISKEVLAAFDRRIDELIAYHGLG